MTILDNKTGEGEFVLTRRFNAPRDLVWKAWTEADRLAQWWGPKGMRLNVEKLEFRPGGIFHYSIQAPNGGMMWGRFSYREITPPERLVFVSSFSDSDGRVVRAPFSDVWPLEIHNTLTLADEGATTEATLRGGPINPSDDELKAYVGMFPSMRQGFAGTFDQLDTYLAQA